MVALANSLRFPLRISSDGNESTNLYVVYVVNLTNNVVRLIYVVLVLVQPVRTVVPLLLVVKSWALAITK